MPGTGVFACTVHHEVRLLGGWRIRILRLSLIPVDGERPSHPHEHTKQEQQGHGEIRYSHVPQAIKGGKTNYQQKNHTASHHTGAVERHGTLAVVDDRITDATTAGTAEVETPIPAARIPWTVPGTWCIPTLPCWHHLSSHGHAKNSVVPHCALNCMHMQRVCSGALPGISASVVAACAP
jgi:hypothetical protein